MGKRNQDYEDFEDFRERWRDEPIGVTRAFVELEGGRQETLDGTRGSYTHSLMILNHKEYNND